MPESTTTTTTPVVKRGWGTPKPVLASPAPGVEATASSVMMPTAFSLKSVMDEQLAESLVEREQRESRAEEAEFEAQLAAALAASQAEAAFLREALEGSSTSATNAEQPIDSDRDFSSSQPTPLLPTHNDNNNTESNTTGAGDDAAPLSDEEFARRLQLELDAQDRMERFEVESTVHRARHGMIVSPKVQSIPAETLALHQAGLRLDHDHMDFSTQLDDWTDSDSDYDDDDDDDDLDAPENWFGANDARVQKPHHEAVKHGGRLSRSEMKFLNQTEPVHLTKHDPIMKQVRNARNLEYVLASTAGDLRGIGITDKVFHGVTQRHFRQQGHRNRVRGNRIDASTKEQVLDARTRQCLLKLVNSDVLDEIHGIVSTGKEANVYHAVAGVDATAAAENLTLGVEPAYGATTSRLTEQGASFAIKIYKTTTNEFKNRTDYVEGDRRFQSLGQSLRGNPRKLIKLWALKEARNLKRMLASGIPVPIPLVLKGNVLVMQFLGQKSVPFPRLHDIDWSTYGEKRVELLGACYEQVAKLMRSMYHDAKLVHGDMSDFNLLIDPRTLTSGRRQSAKKASVAEGDADANPDEATKANVDQPSPVDDSKTPISASASTATASETTKRVTFARDTSTPSPRLYVIDVSQSVELDHPRALDFLRADCVAVTQYFEKSGLGGATLTIRQLFDFIVDSRLKPKDMDRYISAMHEENVRRAAAELPGASEADRAAADEARVLDAVFMNKETYIPRTLQQIPSKDADEEIFGRPGSANQSGAESSDGEGRLLTASQSPLHTAATLGHRFVLRDEVPQLGSDDE